MAKSFVSVFKLDGVPILPPMINDEVRAMVAIYRQKAIEIEKRIEERKKIPIQIDTKTSDQDDGDPAVFQNHPAMNEQDDTHGYPLCDELSSIETTTAASNNTTIENEDWSDSPGKLHEEPSRTLTPAKVESDSHVSLGSLSAISHPSFIPSNNTATMKEGTMPQIATTCLSDSATSKTDLPPWQTSTRTVTPTSDESLPWLPLVRSNTYNLEKPTMDLQSLAEAPKHSTPVDRTTSSPGNVLKPQALQRTPPKKKRMFANGEVALVKKVSAMVLHKQLTHQEQKANEGTVEKPRTKRKPSSRTTSICSTGSGTSERIGENVAHVLTAHEHRMRELLKRQEEERLLLEKSFREKTQELVALCSKSLTTASPVSNFPAGSITPELNPASSVSQLSLCNMSYNSCTDTDDAAYQTCHANGTSEENVAGGESMLNNSLAKPDADRALISDRALSLNTTRTNDVNGNERFALLPQRMKQLQQHQAATIINAYARGYLTRRLLRTEEVQTLKRTIVDIVCFIVHSWSQENGTADATVRRSAGKHFAFCLDRLHDIFINYSPAQRVQMIRRDRYLKSKATTVPR
uniref:Uncharacterized protein n=1 Tax=Anopheles atroparvus TaxID=41427 RepID=A0AAG5CSU7_ANOAO